MTSDDISDDWIVTSLRGVVIIEKGNSIDSQRCDECQQNYHPKKWRTLRNRDYIGRRLYIISASKDELLLGGIRHFTATSQYHAHKKTSSCLRK